MCLDREPGKERAGALRQSSFNPSPFSFLVALHLVLSSPWFNSIIRRRRTGVGGREVEGIGSYSSSDQYQRASKNTNYLIRKLERAKKRHSRNTKTRL